MDKDRERRLLFRQRVLRPDNGMSLLFALSYGEVIDARKKKGKIVIKANNYNPQWHVEVSSSYRIDVSTELWDSFVAITDDKPIPVPVVKLMGPERNLYLSNKFIAGSVGYNRTRELLQRPPEGLIDRARRFLA